MPTMQKAFIVQGLTKLGDAESAEFVVGNLEPNEVSYVLSILRDGSAEQQLQRETPEQQLQREMQASHGELSVENARLKDRVVWLSQENDKLENQIASVPHEMKLLAILCCNRVLIKYDIGVGDYIASVEFFPKLIEMHDGNPQICGMTPNGAVSRFTSAQIISFTALREDVNTDNMPSP